MDINVFVESTEQLGKELIASDVAMPCNVVENGAERSEAERVVFGNGDVMLARLGSRQAHVTPGLPCDGAAEAARELVAGHVARKSQTVITASRVKCRRTIRGIEPSSK